MSKQSKNWDRHWIGYDNTDRPRLRGVFTLAWLILLVGGLCELGWLIGLKYSEGFTRLLPSIVSVAFMMASIGCLGLAVRSIPLSTAYAVWTGTSVAAAAGLGIYLFNEPTTMLRLASISLIILGIIGLRIDS